MTRLNFEDITRSWGEGSFSKVSGMYMDCIPSDQSEYDSNLWYMIQIPATLTSSGTITLNDDRANPSKGFPYNAIYASLNGDKQPIAYHQPYDPEALGPLPAPRSWSSSVTCITRRPFFIKRKKASFDIELWYGINVGDIPGYIELSTDSVIQTCSIPAIPSYVVSYNANGGSGAPTSQTKWYAENLTLSSTVPSYSGYSFKRWNTNANDTGTAYSPGGTYAANSVLGLYAIWNRTISFNANGGSGAPSPQTELKTSAMTISSTVPTRTGWRFTGWNTAADGSGTVYSSGASYLANLPSVILYAQWERIITGVKINNAVIKRVDSQSSTTESDEGEYARIEVPYTIEGAAAANVSLEVSVVPDSGAVPTVTFIEGSSTKSEDDILNGTFAVVAYRCYTDIRYSFSIEVVAANTSASQSDVSRTETLVLPMAFFTMDFLAGGHGVGIGKPATREMFDVGMQAQFDKPLMIAETDVPPTFYYTTKPAVSNLPVKPCIVIQTSNWSIWYCDNATSPSYHQLSTRIKGNAESSYRSGDVNLTPANVGAMAYSNVAPVSVDLNDLIDGGSYALYRGYSTNYPSSLDWGTLYVSTYGNDKFRVHQMLIASTDSSGNNYEIWVRSSYHDNGSRSWGNWLWVPLSSNLSSYLPLSGGTMTGKINLPRGATSYVAAATNAALYQPHNNANEWYPIFSLRTKGQGAWSLGSYDSDNLQFVFNSASNISSGTNAPTVYEINPSSGWMGKWRGYTEAFSTNNTSDTWVPVISGSNLYHRVIPAVLNSSYWRSTTSALWTSSANGKTAYYYQKGNVCSFQVDGAILRTQNSIVGNIPSGYRPPSRQNFSAHTGKTVDAAAMANGDLMNWGTNTSEEEWLTATWPIA